MQQRGEKKHTLSSDTYPYNSNKGVPPRALSANEQPFKTNSFVHGSVLLSSILDNLKCLKLLCEFNK